MRFYSLTTEKFLTWNVDSGNSLPQSLRKVVLRSLERVFNSHRVQPLGVAYEEIKMLELLTIFLATFLVSAATIRLYRALAGWQGFNQSVVGRQKTTSLMKLKPQQGFISLMAPLKQQKAKSVRLRNSSGTIKAPWGW